MSQDPNVPDPNVPDPNVPDPNVPDPNVPDPNVDPNPGPFSVVGIWGSSVDTGNGIVNTQLILEFTGTFSQVVTWGDLMTYDVGFYEEGDGFIHFSVTDHEPKEYLGQEMTWVNSFTYFITPMDQNTMVVEYAS